MSSLIVESPVGNSQLYFTWMEDLQGSEQVDPVPPGLVPTDSASISGKSSNGVRSLSAEGAREISVDRRTRKQSQHFKDEPLEISYVDGTPRISKPVRIGGVMIKLLKRYGISDQEIEEGLARYAAKNLQQSAS